MRPADDPEGARGRPRDRARPRSVGSYEDQLISRSGVPDGRDAASAGRPRDEIRRAPDAPNASAVARRDRELAGSGSESDVPQGPAVRRPARTAAPYDSEATPAPGVDDVEASDAAVAHRLDENDPGAVRRPRATGPARPRPLPGLLRVPSVRAVRLCQSETPVGRILQAEQPYAYEKRTTVRRPHGVHPAAVDPRSVEMDERRVPGRTACWTARSSRCSRRRSRACRPEETTWVPRSTARCRCW